MLPRPTAKNNTDKCRRTICENWFMCKMGISVTFTRNCFYLLRDHSAGIVSAHWVQTNPSHTSWAGCLRQVWEPMARPANSQRKPGQRETALSSQLKAWEKQLCICLHPIWSFFSIFFPSSIALDFGMRSAHCKCGTRELLPHLEET